MSGKGVRSYLRNPLRAVVASLIVTVITVSLMLLLKPAFPEKTSVYRALSPVGEILVEPGENIEIRFRTFTEFDSLSVSLFPDSPSMEFDTEINVISDGYYSLRVENTGSDVLKIMAESPLVYKSIEPVSDGKVADIAVYKKGSPNGLIFSFVALFTALFVFLVTFAFLTDNLTPSKFYLIGAVTLGLGVYSVLFPAWTGHDSDAHFQAAYRFSNILLGKGSDWTARQCDVDFFRGSWKRFVFEGGYRPNPSSDIYLPVVLNNRLTAPADSLDMVPSDGVDYAYMTYYSIFSYLPLSLGLAIGRLMRLSPMYIVHFARYLQGVFFVFVTWRCIKRIKSENAAYLITMVSLFPMSLCYLTAFSYDGAVLTYFLCALSMTICFKEDEGFFKTGNIVEAMFWFFMVGGAKGGAYVICIPFVFMLLSKPLKSRRNLLVVLLTACSLISLVLNNVFLKPKGTELFQLTGGEDFYSTSFAIQHPLKYLGLCIPTLFAFAGEMITDSVGRSEGWNEVAIPAAIIVIIILGMYICVIASEKVAKVTRSQVISFAVVVVVFSLVMPAMLLRDTPLDYKLIMGVQGRYFRPLTPLFVLLIVGLCEFVASKLEKKSLDILVSKRSAVRSFGLILFAAGSVASILAMNMLYLAR